MGEEVLGPHPRSPLSRGCWKTRLWLCLFAEKLSNSFGIWPKMHTLIFDNRYLRETQNCAHKVRRCPRNLAAPAGGPGPTRGWTAHHVPSGFHGEEPLSWTIIKSLRLPLQPHLPL